MRGARTRGRTTAALSKPTERDLIASFAVCSKSPGIAKLAKTLRRVPHACDRSALCRSAGVPCARPAFQGTITMTRTTCRLLPALAIATLASALSNEQAHAGFSGLTVTSVGNVGGRSVFQVWANFTHANNALRQCLSHTVLSGSMSGVMHDDAIGGSWNPSWTSSSQACRDSFVTISGFPGMASMTALDAGFAGGSGPVIAQGAGWMNPAPNINPVTAGSDLKIMVMQVALAPGSAGYTARMTIGYRMGPYNGGVALALGTYTVPSTAPSAAGLALLPMLPFLPGRRRRSAPLQ